MGSYLQGYGVGEERRNRIIKRIIIAVAAALILGWVAYLLLQDYSEKQLVKRYLAEVNAHDYQSAYAYWGCTAAKPCQYYDYSRFLRDWGPQKNIASPWKIASVDGCRTFVTVNVQAAGAELESLGVQRGANTIMYAPSPECQERKWHWKQFFQRIFGGGSSS
jgi:hypothetical protein